MASEHPSDQAQLIVAPRARTSANKRALAELCRLAPSRGILVIRIVGLHQEPERLVISASRAKIAELGAQYAQELCFEEDVRLSPI